MLLCLSNGTCVATSGQNNIAFACQLQLGEAEACVDILLGTSREPEAGLLARTYVPELMPKVVKAWKGSLIEKGKSKLAEAIGDPETNPGAFEEGWAHSGLIKGMCS